MRVLFLDDDYTRHAAFLKNHQDDHVVQAWTYAQAVTELLVNDRFDRAYLDHDLPQTHTSMQREMTGADVAEFIAKMPAESRPREIVIHSWNEMGRLRIQTILTGLGMDVRVEIFSPSL